MDLFGFIKYHFHFCCLSKKDIDNNLLFNLGKKFLTKKLDLIFYLKIIDQIHHLKTLLLKPYQIFLLDNKMKINLLSKNDIVDLQIVNEDFSSENDVHVNILQHIIGKKMENSLEPIDKIFINKTDQDIQYLIESLARSSFS
jgi:hypothetical protein